MTKTNMNKEFIPYEQALDLKELGFDERCFGHYNPNGVFFWKILCSDEDNDHTLSVKDIMEHVADAYVEAPTFSQVFRWFREEYGLYHHIVPEFYVDDINFNWQIFWYLPVEEWTKDVINDGTGLYGDNGEYPTQEEAERACLTKLIEIVKDKK